MVLVILVRRHIVLLTGFLPLAANSGRCFRLALPDMAIRPINVFLHLREIPYLISPDDLLADGLLTQADLNGMKDLPASHVDFGLLIPRKLDLLQKAFSTYQSHPEHLRPGL